MLKMNLDEEIWVNAYIFIICIDIHLYLSIYIHMHMWAVLQDLFMVDNGILMKW